jgi:hypothetical protein
MKKALPFCALIITTFLAACSGNSVGTASNATPIPQPALEVTASPLKAEAVFSAFKEAGFPVKDEVQYTEETDNNNLLGRPGQYVGKINFSDERSIKKATAKQGNTIEVFANNEDLERRKNYTETISKSGGVFAQYIYAHKNVLLRLDHQLVPKDAGEYERVLKSL